MSAEIRRLIDNARNATGELRDAAREGREIGFRKRDPLVAAIHNALDKLEALLPPAGSPPVEALVRQWREAATTCQQLYESGDHAFSWYSQARMYRACADQLEAALKRQEEEELSRAFKAGFQSLWICEQCHSRQGFSADGKCFACEGPLLAAPVNAEGRG